MPKRRGGEFGRNVFINCPFDEDYFPLLRPLLFTLLYLGYQPRIALERSDSGEQRISKICELIRSSKYGIHDLSRLKAKAEDEYYRLNMPFELGIDYGCRNFAAGRLAGKKCLILEKSRYDYMKALSDLSGVDIKNHDDEPIKVIRCVRNWFVETAPLENVKGATVIWNKFSDFTSDFFLQRRQDGFSDDDLNMMPVPEYLSFMRAWIQAETGVP